MIATDPTMKKDAEREALRAVIQQWNANRLDLFELSEPNENLEFHGVMRFYFHDSGQRVATKCIRVASDATVTAVIETLIEKFRPDMRMLSVPEYALYVTHENRDERRLNPDEKPLLVQLNWHKDDREGRFLLKRIDDKTKMPSDGFQESSFRRKLSKREKKQLKKQEKLNRLKSSGDVEEGSVAEKLYAELPETSFTRSISNPEAVMQRRRQQKLEKKLQQFRSKDGGPDTGGTLKIYGEALCGDVPYKTLLLSVGDTTTHVVKEMLSKYGMDKEDAHNYCLVQVNTGDPLGPSEYILDEDECPLAILMNHPTTSGSIMFHVRRRPADYHPRKRKKKPQQKWQRGDLDGRYDDGLPYFLELNPDGSEITSGTAKRHVLHPNVTEVGLERTGGPHLQLFGPNIQPRHCVLAHTDGLVTVTPCSRDAETYVNGQRIYETTILQNGALVKFGRIHNFRFIDVNGEDRGRGRHPDFAGFDRLSKDDNNSTSIQGTNNNSTNYETTFDVDGNVETISLKDMDSRSQRSVASSRDGNRLSNYERYPRGSDPILPAVLEVREDTEETFLHAVVVDLDPNVPSFKLAPTYTLYLTARYRASTHYRPELTPTERAHRLTVLLARVASMIQHVVQERYSEPKSLAFWMANASELLHFLKCDRHISAFSLDAQDILAESVQIAFRNLVACHQGELTSAMIHFLSERDDAPNTVLLVLSSAMALLRRCRVNAALTIQLFSQLFHFVKMIAFNKIVRAPSQPQGINYCSRAWGTRLRERVSQIGTWAERQGLELAANCHLGRLAEAAYLLEAPKYNANDLAQLSSTCLKLNSLQLRALLRGYQPQHDEPKLPLELIDNVVHVAENVADELARSDGREVKLEEDVELQLPFLLPEDGYSCDVVRGVPQGLTEFLQPLQNAGLCRMNVQPTSSGQWTIYMTEPMMNLRSPSAMSNRLPATQQPLEIQTIRLHKSNNGMGLSIVAAKGAGQDRLGIYIKSVVAGGAADVDGRLQAGDQLLKVDGQGLVGITQEKAAEYLVRTGPVVTLEVAKQGAIYHGLATLLSQPSPLMSRANKEQGRPVSEHFEKSAPKSIPSSTSLMNLQSKKEVPGLANGFIRKPIPCNLTLTSNVPSTFPFRQVFKNPSEVYRGGSVKSVSGLPQIVINEINDGNDGDGDNDNDDESVYSNDSDDPNKSKIFSRIQEVKFVNAGGQIHRSGDYLSREETEKCIEELKNIVADFEKCTLEYAVPKPETKTSNATKEEEKTENDVDSSVPFVVDSSSLKSDSEDSDSFIYDYHPLVNSMSDLPKPHVHSKLVRADAYPTKKRETTFLDSNEFHFVNEKEDPNFENFWPVGELQKEFERMERKLSGIRSPRKSCDHNYLRLLDKSEPKSVSRICKIGGGKVLKESSSPSKINMKTGKVAALTRHFSRMGDAGLIKFHDMPKELKVVKKSSKETFKKSQVKMHNAQTQITCGSRLQTRMTDAQVQTVSCANRLNVTSRNIPIPQKKLNVSSIRKNREMYDYDYSLIYSLGSKKIGFSLDNLLGFPAERLIEKRIKSSPSIKEEVKKEGKLKKFPEDYIQRRKSSGKKIMAEFKWSSDDILNLMTSKENGKKWFTEGGPRRMSERDLPSRLYSEDMKKHLPPHAPIQSSKSVPSLHSGGNGGGCVQNSEPRHSQEVFNPGYSRTSSTNSIPQSALRSRSNQNLSDARVGPAKSMVSQSGALYPTQSTPSLNQSQHYAGQSGQPNQSMLYNSNNSNYQHESTPNSSYPGMVNTPVGSPYLNSRNNTNYTPASGSYTISPHMNHFAGSPGGQYHSTPQSNQNTANNQYSGQQNVQTGSQFQGSPGGHYQGGHPMNHYQGSPGSNHYPAMTQGGTQFSNNSQNASYQGTGGNYQHHPGNHYPGGPPGNSPAMYQYQNHPGNYGVNNQGDAERFYQNLSVYRNQDGFNKNKVLSSDDRSPNNPPLVHYSPMSDSSRDRPASAYIPPHSLPHQNPGMQGRSQSSRDMFRQEAKFQEMTEEVRRRELRGGQPAGQPGVSFGPPPVAPKPPFGEEYRESPPPPPPPATTHPLLQKANSIQDNRYQASMSEPPRGGYYPASAGDRRQYPYTGTNPWEREEKEKEQARRREAGRQWREQQISELSSIPSRTPQQEEQLRALILEKEFEKRAEEAKHEDEDEGEDESAVTESSERVQGLLRMAQQQNGPIIRPATASIAQMKLEEVRRQHAQGQTLNLRATQTKPQVNVNDLRFENLSMNDSHHHHHYNDYYEEKTNETHNQTNDPTSNYPTSQQNNSGVLKTSLNSSLPTKRVSFSDPNANPTVNHNNISNMSGNNNINSLNNNSNSMEKIIEDPNNFINEAENLLNSPKTPEGTPSFTGNTPGVIGAQEVYRDPRQRLLAEQKQNSTPKVPGPEKLSFKEKMKMFAMETGEDGTPRDKVKISRAQRDIDNITNPLGNN